MFALKFIFAVAAAVSCSSVFAQISCKALTPFSCESLEGANVKHCASTPCVEAAGGGWTCPAGTFGTKIWASQIATGNYNVPSGGYSSFSIYRFPCVYKMDCTGDCRDPEEEGENEGKVCANGPESSWTEWKHYEYWTGTVACP